VCGRSPRDNADDTSSQSSNDNDDNNDDANVADSAAAVAQTSTLSWRDQRRAKNKEAARNSRQKKKEYMDTLKKQIADLAREADAERTLMRRMIVQNTRTARSHIQGNVEALFAYDAASTPRVRLAQYAFENLRANVAPPYMRLVAHSTNAIVREDAQWADALVAKLDLSIDQQQRVHAVLSSRLAQGDGCAKERLRLEQVGRKIDEFQARHADLALRLRGHIARVREICGERDAAALLFSSAAAPAANSAAPNMAMLWYNVA